MCHANHCDRCHGPLALSMMSKCNRDILCTPCQDNECEAPGYAAAEVAAVRAGDDHFPASACLHRIKNAWRRGGRRGNRLQR
jgi:hypothetical protein